VYRVSVRAPAGEIKPSEAPASSRASIAVLPFTNMSGDPEQEYFADGLTEDIITELSHFKSLQVTGRNSSFHFKGKVPKVTELSRELKVAYVLEGSVRRAGGRVRVTAQLIETATGSHLWDVPLYVDGLGTVQAYNSVTVRSRVDGPRRGRLP
jgi:adenylate cyclase